MRKSILRSFIFFTITSFNISLHAQSKSATLFGLGAGLDYGGLGLKVEHQPIRNIGIFVGGGYNLLEPAYNVGASYRFLVNHTVQPMLTAMYGYNGVLKIQDREDLSDSFYGWSIGTGVEIHSPDKSKNFSFRVLLPFRNEFDNRYEELRRSGFEFKQKPTKVTISLGYNFVISNFDDKKK